jgi:hypothetical protein
MHLTLNFDEGKVQGAGIDNPGHFVIDGSYDGVSSRLRWVKQYVGKHSVQYEGRYEGDEIIGTWSLAQDVQGAGSKGGEFRIWPLPDGQYPGDEPLRSILMKEIQRKG